MARPTTPWAPIPGPATGPSAESSADGSVDTTAGPVGPLDCDALCDPYEACDESVFLTCQANCTEIVPPLDAFDAGCGAAAAAYFECRFTLSCEDAVALQGELLDPNPCADSLDAYLNTCLTVVPERCDPLCDSLLECFELPPTPENVGGCQFECLLYEAGAARISTAECDSATDALIECFATAECQDTNLLGCDEAEAEHFLACST